LERFQGAALVAATITVGIMTGVFHLYAYAIMPGLGRTDDRTFVGAFQSIDRSIINPLFMATFAVRERFDEAKWVRWNLVRAVATTVAFGCLTWALVLHGRMTQGGA
jgi:uncharacterized membrane protein